MPDLSVLASWAQIISLPVAIIAIIISILLYRRSRQRRALACEFGPMEYPIEIRAGEALKGDIEIRYQGRPIENLFLIRVKLRNTGNVAIRKDDVVEPVTFSFEPGVELVRPPQVLDKKPENLKVSWSSPPKSDDLPPSNATATSLNFDLLNPGDGLTVEFLFTGAIGSLTLSMTERIEGITEIEFVDPEEARLSRAIAMGWMSLALFFMLFLCIVVFSDYLKNLKNTWVWWAIPALAVAYLVWYSVGRFVFRLVQYRRRKRKD